MVDNPYESPRNETDSRDPRRDGPWPHPAHVFSFAIRIAMFGFILMLLFLTEDSIDYSQGVRMSDLIPGWREIGGSIVSAVVLGLLAAMYFCRTGGNR